MLNHIELKKNLIIITKSKLVKSKEIISENSTPIINKKINKNIFNSSKKIEKNISKNVSAIIVKISNDHLEKSANNNKLQSNFLNFSKNLPVPRK